MFFLCYSFVCCENNNIKFFSGRLVAIVEANKRRSLAFSEMFLVVMMDDDHILRSGIYCFGSENGNAFIGLVFFQDHTPLLCLLVVL